MSAGDVESKKEMENEEFPVISLATTDEGLANAAYELVDVASQLPSRIIIRGNNRKYLRAHNAKGNFLFKFDSTDPSSNMLPLQIISAGYNPGYQFRVKSVYFNKYWRCHQDKEGYVHADSTNGTEPGCLFQLARVIDHANTYLFKSVQCNEFVRLYYNNGAEEVFRHVLRAINENYENGYLEVYSRPNISETEETQETAQDDQQPTI